MNNSSINSIGGTEQSRGNTSSAKMASSQVESRIKSAMGSGTANVSVQFRVDEETNDVTVFLVDRKSKKILRTIPSSELQKLQIGELLKLTG